MLKKNLKKNSDRGNKMDRKDVEFILIKTMEYWSYKIKERVTLSDIIDLSIDIWDEIGPDYSSEDEYKKYVVTKSMLDEILANGRLKVRYDDGSKIEFVLEKEGLSAASLENGKILVWDDNVREYGIF